MLQLFFYAQAINHLIDWLATSNANGDFKNVTNMFYRQKKKKAINKKKSKLLHSVVVNTVFH